MCKARGADNSLAQEAKKCSESCLTDVRSLAPPAASPAKLARKTKSAAICAVHGPACGAALTKILLGKKTKTF